MILELVARALERPLVIADAIERGPAAAAIVVLGAPVGPGGGLSEVAAERVLGGVALWRRGLAPTLVFSGGCTGGAHRAEAEVMADAARVAGVPAAALVVETRSRTTAENAREVARLLAPGASVWVVTQPFHGRRARWCFRRAGLAPRVWHLTDSVQYRDRARAVRWLTREYAAWAQALIRRP